MRSEFATYLTRAWGGPGGIKTPENPQWKLAKPHDEKYYVGTSLMRSSVQALHERGGAANVLSFPELMRQRRNWTELNCCLPSLPREGPQYFLTVPMLKAAWLRCWQETEGLEGCWDQQQQVETQIGLAFEFLTVYNLGNFWCSGSPAWERLCWPTSLNELAEEEGKGEDLLGEDWREEQLEDTALALSLTESIMDQNYHQRNHQTRLGGST